MTAMEQLGAFAARGVRGRVTGALRDKVRLHVADTVAAWAAGAASPEGKALIEFAAATSQDASMSDRVLLRTAVTRLSEVDDIHLASGTTPGSVIVPAALTLAEATKASPDALAEAIVAGYEAMVRLGFAINGPKILYRGIWPTYFTAPFGVAAVAARLLDLDETKAAHALALSLVFASPGVGHPGGPKMGRWLALGQAARQGCSAALAAGQGFTGDVQLFEKDFLSAIYAITPDVPSLTAGLGETFSLNGVSFKPWCAARQTIAASQALKELVQEGTALADISAVRVAVPPPYLKMVNHGVSPGDRSSYLTSAQCQIALSVIAPELQFIITPDPARIPASVIDFMKKVTVEADEALLAHFPKTWPAKVSVITAKGTREKPMLHVPGDPERPFDAAQVADKFSRVVAPLAGADQARALYATALEAITASGGAGRVIAALEAR